MGINITINKKEEEVRELINPFVQFFDEDDYHDLDIDTDVQIDCDGQDSDNYMRSVKMIRRRYTDIYQYEQARSLYEDYLDKLVEAYGGLEHFDIAYLTGAVTNYLPPNPTLKPTRRIKMILKNGLLVSNKLKFPDNIVERIKEMRGDITIKKLKKEKFKFSKSARKDLKDELSNENIARNKKLRKASSIKFLEMYFQEKEAKKKKKKDKPPTLADYFEDNVEIIPEGELDLDATVYYHGKYITNRQKLEFEFYDDLDVLGWDSYKLIQDMNNTIKNKRTTKLYMTTKKNKKKDKKFKTSSFIKSLSEIEDTYDMWD